MTSNTVLAVVLNWNSEAYIARCIEHIRAQQHVRVQLLVVDNGSTDGSLALLRELRPDEVHRLPSNLGFAGGMNVGLNAARTRNIPFAWLLNTDVFPEPDCLAALLDRMRTGDVGMLTPRLLTTEGTEQHAGGLIDWSNGENRAMNAEELADLRTDGCWITGTAPLVRTSVLSTTGGFEPSFFAYWEDNDLSVRFARAGAPVAAVPDARAMHVGSGSSGKYSPFVEFLMARNRWLFLKRNATGGSTLARWLRVVGHGCRRAAWFEQLGRPPEVSAAILAGLSAARQQRFGKPTSLGPPARLERLCYLHPWRFSSTVESLAGLLEPRAASSAPADRRS